MLDAGGGCFRRVHLGARTTSAGEDRVFITLTDAVKEKSEAIRIAEATARAIAEATARAVVVAERADEEGPSVTNQVIRTNEDARAGCGHFTYWESAVHMIADVSKSDKIVVEKSTVPVKTAEAIEKILTHNNKGINFQILSNPEFLAEGTAIANLDLFFSTEVERHVAEANIVFVSVNTPTNTEAGTADVNEESKVPVKVKATRARIEEGNVDTTEATFTTPTPIVTRNVGGNAALAKGKAIVSKSATTSGEAKVQPDARAVTVGTVVRAATVAIAKAAPVLAATPEETPTTPEEIPATPEEIPTTLEETPAIPEEDKRLQVSAVLKKI
jgi:hypothetical protein